MYLEEMLFGPYEFSCFIKHKLHLQETEMFALSLLLRDLYE